MLLAYLRGLLEPEYDQGLRSILRENMILDALSMQLDTELVKTQTLVQAAYAPLLEPKAARELMNKQQVTLQNLRYLSEFDDRISSMTEGITTGEQADLITLYEALEEVGLVGEDAVDLPEPSAE